MRAVPRRFPRHVVVLGVAFVLTSGLAVPGGAQDASPSDDPSPSESLHTVERAFGADRYETAAGIALRQRPKDAVALFVTTGRDFPDALTLGPGGGREARPILLVDGDVIPPVTRQALIDLAPEYIIVVGGPAAVGPNAFAELQQYSSKWTRRVAGADRYETAAQVAVLDPTYTGTVILATGTDYPDALAAGPAGAAHGAVILLTRPDRLPDSTVAALSHLAPQRVIVLGGQGAVSNAVVADVETRTGVAAERIGGVDRFETSAMVADQLVPAGGHPIGVATGLGYADALTLGPHVGSFGAPVLLSRTAFVPAPVEVLLASRAPSSGIVAGGAGALTDDVLERVRVLLEAD